MALAAFIAALSTACYRPDVADGMLRCGGAGVCPDGYGCSTDGHCWRNGTGHELTDASEVSSPDVSCAPPTRPLCTAQTSTACDPVCQSGSCNWCNQKCSYAGTGDVVCSSKDEGGTLGTGATCTVTNGGTAQQSDNCAPGNICLSAEVGAVGGHCFALCNSSADCIGDVACGTLALPASANGTHTVRVCDVVPDKCDDQTPASCCDPTSASSGGRTCREGSFCYLVAPDGQTGDSRTSCELATGMQAKTGSCSSSHDCLPKLTCGPDGFCHVVCTATQLCSGGSACIPYGKQYGYCRP